MKKGENGMIIIGYQGIGKSTLAKKDLRYIDLESGNFFVDGKRGEDWYKVYVQIAKHLSEQGYIVFVSSHQVVRDELGKIDEFVGACFPDESLEKEWVYKLNKRYVVSHLEKDYKAWMNAKERFKENIGEIREDCERYRFKKFVIEDFNYNLKEIIKGE